MYSEWWFVFVFKQKTAYEVRISDCSSDVCSSDLGPTGRLLGHLGSHTWRPANVHFKVRKDGFEPLTTQYYFEGGKWVDDDCCHGVTPDLITPETIEDGVRVMTLDFVIEREQAEQRKSATEKVA